MRIDSIIEKAAVKPTGTKGTVKSVAPVKGPVVKPVAKVAAKPATQPAKLAGKPVLAPRSELNQLAAELSVKFPDGRFIVHGKNSTKPVEHIRVFSLSRNEFVAALNLLGFKQVDLIPDQTRLSTKYAANIFSFTKHGEIFSFVLSSMSDDDAKAGVGIKEYSPTNLGLAGKILDKKALIAVAKSAVTIKAKDENLRKALLGLIDIAANGCKGTLPAALNKAINNSRGQLSQDFGEILAPIAIMKGKEMAEFPVGNSPIVDVRIGKTNISVKSLTGSGTSFRTIADLLDGYEKTHKPKGADKTRFNILKQFHPSSPGKNVDKIIAAAATANIPEYHKLMEILGTSDVVNFTQLEEALKAMKIKDYKRFLKTFYPAMKAGGWKMPAGLPADGAYNMGLSLNKPEKEKVAGKYSFDKNPVVGGANILTYMLGTGLLNHIKKGNNAHAFSKMMTDIVSKGDAVIGKIDITLNGGLKLVTRPFSDLEFEFQYHAPSHIPGNNLPGFIAKLN